MMNIFSALRPLRWFLMVVGLLAGILAYSDFTGLRLMSFSNQQQWSAAGPGGHK